LKFFKLKPQCVLRCSIIAEHVITEHISCRQHKTPDFLGGEEHLVLDGINHLPQLIPMWACRLDSWMTLHQIISWKHQDEVQDHLYQMQGNHAQCCEFNVLPQAYGV